MRVFLLRSVLFIGSFALGSHFIPSDAYGQSPASVQAAASVIDFSRFKPLGNEPKMLESVTASQRYETGGKVTDIAKLVTDKLKSDGWKELDGTYTSPEMASASFTKSQFVIVLSVSPASPGSKDARSIVSLSNLGNLDWSKLPIPKGWTSTYTMPSMAMYQASVAPEKAKQDLQNALTQAGWTPYGDAIGSSYYRKEAIKLMASIQAAPTAPGSSMIQFTSEQLSYVFPIPESITQLQHTDSLLNILFDTSLSRDKVNEFYRDELKQKGWVATTDKPILERKQELTFFVNDAKERLELVVSEVEGKTRVKVRYVTAAQAAEENQKASAAAEAAKAKNETRMADAKAKEETELLIDASIGAKPSKSDNKSATWSLTSGQGAAMAKKLIAALEKDGWKAKQNVAQKEAGDFDLQKGEFRLRLSYIDPGFIPAELELQVFGPGKLKLETE